MKFESNRENGHTNSQYSSTCIHLQSNDLIFSLNEVVYMSEQKYELGEVVRLRSGGPLMTVKTFQGKVYECVWFDNEFKETFSYFEEYLLLSREEISLDFKMINNKYKNENIGTPTVLIDKDLDVKKKNH